MEDFIVCEDREAYYHVVFIGSMDECLNYIATHLSEYRMFIDEWKDPTE